LSERRLLITILVCLFVLGIPTLAIPYWRDQSIFALIGDVMLSEGFPYRDAFDFKPPGIHLIYAMTGIVSGGKAWGIRLLDLVSLLAGVTALYRLLRPISVRAAGIAAAHYGVAALMCLGFRDMGQAEGFMAALILWSFVLIQNGPHARRRVVAAGLCFGAAGLLKYTAILYAPLLIVFARLQVPNRDASGEISGIWPDSLSERTRWTVFALSAATPIAVAMLYLLVGGALEAFIEIQRDYLPGYSRMLLASGSAQAIASSVRTVVGFFETRPFLLGPPILGLVMMALSRALPLWIVPVLGILTTLVGVVAQGKFFYYHWIPIFPFLAWATGIGVDRLLDRFRGRRSVMSIVGGLLVVLAILSLAFARSPVLQERIGATRYLMGIDSRETYHSRPAFGRFGRGDFCLSATWSAAEEVQRICPRDGSLFVWGFEPLLYTLSGRKPASRFIYIAPLLSPWSPERWHDEIVATLLDAPPDVIVIMSDDRMPWVTGLGLDSRAALSLYPEISMLLSERYAAAGRLEHFTFFTRTR